MTHFRVRHLRRTRPDLSDLARSLLKWRPNVPAMPTQLAGMVADVECEERLLRAEEVADELTHGRLKSTDLVWRDGWRPLTQHPDFEDLAERRARVERWQQTAKSAALFAVGAAFVGLYFFVYLGMWPTS